MVALVYRALHARGRLTWLRVAIIIPPVTQSLEEAR
jgi:hypothetical protein